MNDIRDTIVLPKPIKTYPKESQRIEKPLFNDCMKVKDGRIAWLIETAGILGIDKSKLDFTPDSLVVLWEGLIPYVRGYVSPPPITLENIAECPEWFGTQYSGIYNNTGGADLFSIWLLDGLMYYIGEVFIRNIQGLEWQMGNLTPKDVNFGLPRIRFAQGNLETANFAASPLGMAQSALAETWQQGGAPTPEKIRTIYNILLQRVTEGFYRKRPAELEPNIAAPLPEAFEFGIEQNDDDADYPYHVWFFEGTEYELGIKTFNSLRKRFAAIDGIKKVIHEDREVFLIKSDLAIETLKERIWAAFCQACTEVVANKQAQAEARAAKRAAAKAVKIV